MKWETKKYALKCPIDITTGTGDDAKTVNVTDVQVSTPKGKAMRQIMRLVGRVEADPENYSAGEMTMDAIQVMSDMPEGGIDELHPADITGLGDIIAPFLEAAMGGGPLNTSADGTATTSSK
jgi:hypothetical protein